jgi:hypothetical protein
MRPAIRVPASALAGALLLLAWTRPLSAQTPSVTPTGIDRIEEDWQVVVATPSPEEVGPQISTTMSPVGDNDLSFMSFSLNYRDDPFSPGGLEIRAWSGKTAMASDPERRELLRTAGETILWTQQMALANGTLTYDVIAGSSVTWGSFGVNGELSVAVPSSEPSLDAYSPDLSVQCSGATWQSNRVTSMQLVRIRYYRGGTLVATDSTPRTVIGSP